MLGGSCHLPWKPCLISPDSSGLSRLWAWVEVTTSCLLSYTLDQAAWTRPHTQQ